MDNERKIPTQAFDSEYMTEFLREVKFLSEKGIKYSFVKKTRDYGISQYKYKKSPTLFAALVEFYAILDAERAVRKANREKAKGGLVPHEKVQMNKTVDDVISPEQLKKAQEILEKAVQQGVIKNGIDVTNLKTEEVTVTIEKDDTI